jgi:hypothetical protein
MVMVTLGICDPEMNTVAAGIHNKWQCVPAVPGATLVSGFNPGSRPAALRILLRLLDRGLPSLAGPFSGVNVHWTFTKSPPHPWRGARWDEFLRFASLPRAESQPSLPWLVARGLLSPPLAHWTLILRSIFIKDLI